MLVFFTDTDCDITPDIAKEYGFELISMPYFVNEKEIKNFLKTGVDGLVIFITNAENTEVKKIADEPEFKTKLIYILADAEFNVE